ncbi:BLUF domain-containing protein [Rubrivirga sp. IMCC43871]|uniref:BLUF domain-containing protein n=1 Tax=Rubrivirga sp. IMCC43871 TaxID=3391575 RepID=UPI0039902E9C
MISAVGYEEPVLRTFGYISDPAVAFSDRDLSDLLLSARRFNARHDVTGKLVVLEDETGITRFAQVIEGPAESIAVVTARIKSDPRHGRLQVVVQGDIDGRRFAGWDMAIARVERKVFEPEAAVLFG